MRAARRPPRRAVDHGVVQSIGLHRGRTEQGGDTGQQQREEGWPRRHARLEPVAHVAVLADALSDRAVRNGIRRESRTPRTGCPPDENTRASAAAATGDVRPLQARLRTGRVRRGCRARRRCRDRRGGLYHRCSRSAPPGADLSQRPLTSRTSKVFPVEEKDDARTAVAGLPVSVVLPRPDRTALIEQLGVPVTPMSLTSSTPRSRSRVGPSVRAAGSTRCSTTSPSNVRRSACRCASRRETPNTRRSLRPQRFCGRDSRCLPCVRRRLLRDALAQRW